VRVAIPNPVVDDGRKPRRLLYHRLYAEGAVKIAAPEALAVPRTAVLSAGEPLVYVEAGTGAYEQRRVKLGRRGDEFVEVLEGVPPASAW
jgi:Cu(I)/Ag(I) efflux system membrane fusion protein